MAITIKNQKQIDFMRESGRIVGELHNLLGERIQVGMSTMDLDQIAAEFIKSQGATSSFLGYHGYPANICVSINEEVVHGIPSKERIIQDGDVVSIDLGAYKNGYHGDAARTHLVGNCSEEAKRLVAVTRESFFVGVEMVKPGNHLHQIGQAIQTYVESNGFSVVRDLVGHGIGSELHEDPQVPNYKTRGRGPKLQEGMVLAIEPMVNVGRYEVRVLSDDWTIVSIDHSLSAHYEHSVLVTKDGYELLTQIPLEVQV